MTAAEMDELRFLLILSKMKENADKLASTPSYTAGER